MTTLDTTRPIQFWPTYKKEGEPQTGTFHGWGLDIEYSAVDEAPVSFTAAIVELPDGTVKLLHPNFFRFTDTPA